MQIIPVTFLIFDYIYLYVVSCWLQLCYHMFLCTGQDNKTLAYLLFMVQ